MSEFDVTRRERRKTLLIVEGHHEKYELLSVLSRCFPELGIQPEDIWIYGTNIYVLFGELVKAYGADWDEQDVDLPFVISAAQTPGDHRYKRDYLNILLIFDYERQEPRFNADVIRRMQMYFNDPADVGKMYLNYPMLESYLHFQSFPDPDFRELKVPAFMQRGGEYKEKVQCLPMARSMDFYTILPGRLEKALEIEDTAECQKCAEVLLACSNEAQLEEAVRKISSTGCGDKNNVSHYLTYLVSERSYVGEGMCYWEYMRKRFAEIIGYNICKANRILGGDYNIADGDLRKTYEALSLIDVLQKQNEASADMQSGFIWVLNTCLFFVVDYRFSLIEPSKGFAQIQT